VVSASFIGVSCFVCFVICLCFLWNCHVEPYRKMRYLGSTNILSSQDSPARDGISVKGNMKVF